MAIFEPDAMKRRRQFLGQAAMLSLPAWAQAATPSHDPFGFIRPPRRLPDISVLNSANQRIALQRLMKGKLTAVQLMFTGCSAICPLQGALFAAVAAKVPSQDKDLQLISLSIDPLTDTAAAMRQWREQFAAHPLWQVLAPREQDLPAILALLKGEIVGNERHSGNIFLFDRQAQLVYKTAEMPPASHVLEMLHGFAGRTV
ncbi:SCO family protein [Undibacterium rugosum]|uniref:SCO family protein n=1 Tax=Undibacterium rugosum TaxID=2762291 RepID=UPI001B82AE5C|nr:SCO family protein [Undibacterium rugosum]MBR7779700.1 SCO family protein [Undibacterium rugosum]